MPEIDPEQAFDFDAYSDFPLLRYATQFWIAHATSSQKSQADLLDRLDWPLNRFVDLWVQHCSAMQTSLPPGHRPPRGMRLAHVVARHGLTTLLSKMLERRDQLDINAPDCLQRTPLVYATERGHTAVVETRIGAGACVQTRDYIGATPLHWAALRGHTEVMSLLLSHGAIAEAKVQGGCTPLAWAVEGGSKASIELLLQACDGGMSLDSEYVLPHRAYLDPHALELPLLEHVEFFFVGASPVNGLCAWMSPQKPCRAWKVPRAWWDVLSFLVSPRHPPRAELPVIGSVETGSLYGGPKQHLSGSTYGHRTLLLRVMELGQQPIVRLLLDKGASPRLNGTHGWSPIRLAKKKGDTEISKMLEEAAAG